MSRESLEQFWHILSENVQLQEQLRLAPDLTSLVDLILTLGEEYGYSFTAEEVIEYIGAQNSFK